MGCMVMQDPDLRVCCSAEDLRVCCSPVLAHFALVVCISPVVGGAPLCQALPVYILAAARALTGSDQGVCWILAVFCLCLKTDATCAHHRAVVGAAGT
jgi:hypothetical protein